MFDELRIFHSRADSSRNTDHSLFSDENSHVKLKRKKPYVHQSADRQPMIQVNHNISLRSNTEPYPKSDLITPDPRLIRSVGDEIIEDSEEEVTELISSSCLPSNYTIETSIPWNSQKLESGEHDEPGGPSSSQLSCISNDNFHAQDFAMPIDSELEFYTSQPQIGLSQAVSDDEVILMEDTIDEKEKENDEYDDRFEANITDNDELSEEFDKHDILDGLRDSQILSPIDDEIEFRIGEMLECSTQHDLSDEEEVKEVVKEVVQNVNPQMEIPQEELPKKEPKPNSQESFNELELKRPILEPVRKRIASKPLSSICNSNQPRFRVGLSKRVKIDSLHTYLKKSK